MVETMMTFQWPISAVNVQKPSCWTRVGAYA